MINYAGTAERPSVHFDETQGLFEIKGKSTLKNPGLFYNPLIEWITIYCAHPNIQTRVSIHLEMFDTASSRFIEIILRKFQSLHQTNQNLIINWYYKDTDSLQAGEAYESIINIPFRFIEIED
jgi:hypothetical protein